VRTVTLVVAIAAFMLVGPSATAAAESAALGVFQSRPCTVDLDTSRHVDCGTIRFPQVRSKPGLGSVRLNLAIVRAPNPLPDPILFVMGGPDYPGVDGFSTFYLGHKEFSQNRDWILFDARGTGGSEPRLSCPELDQFDANAFPDDEPGGITDVGGWAAANQACATRLRNEGVIPRAYASADVARDLRDLRMALGIDQWNVLGLSAGGEATLELLRLDPDGIRSAILDSPVTRNYRPSFDYREGGYGLMEHAFRACAQQPDCAQAYPNLRQRFLAEVDRLNDHPVQVEVGVSTGGTETWTISGAFLLDEAAYFTGHPDTAADWPDVADFLARGNIEAYTHDIVLEPPQPFDDVIARGRTLASRCRDAFDFQNLALLDREQRRFPRYAEAFATNYQVDMPACRAWHVGRSSNAGHGYIGSDVPVLTLRGEYDNGADDNGHILGQAEHFPNGFAYTFPAHGHIQFLDWPTSSGACAQAIAAEFLAQPGVEPDSSCIAAMSPLVFNVGGDSQAFGRPYRVTPLEWESALRP
jgi:pimeloyl-ACP methyl ester carboxylesterase